MVAIQREVLTIRQASRATGLTVHTLRYYERIGLLTPVGRASNGHRRYDQVDIDRIIFLNKMRKTGMPLEQIKEYALLMYQGDAGIPGRITLLQTHRCAVLEQMAELTEMLTAIDKKLDLYREKVQK